MNTYDQAKTESLQKFNQIQNAIKPPEDTGVLGAVKTYFKSGVSLPRLKEEGFTTPISMAYNFLIPGVAQDFLNIPSGILGGTVDIVSGNVTKGLGRIGLSGLDLATTLYTGGAGKALTKGVQKTVLGGALKGLEGQALETAGKQITRKEVGKAALSAAGIGTAYGLTGGLKDLDKVPDNQKVEYLMTNSLLGGAIGGLTGGLLTYGTARAAMRDLNKIESDVLKNIATKNYDELVSAPINKKGQYVIDFVDDDLKKASLQAMAGQKPGLITNFFTPVKKLGAGMENAYVNWVNTRAASGAYGFLKFKEFRNYVDRGVQGILDFEKDASKFPGIKKYFDDMYQTLVKAKILKEGQYFDEVNYLPLLFDNTSQEIAAAFEKKRRLSTKPSFAFERVIQGYNEGIELGLKPRFNNISEVTQWYEQTARKAIADKNFFNTLVSNKWVVPTRFAPKDWVELDVGFPKFRSRSKDGFIQDKYAAPPEFAEVINNYLGSRDKGVLAGIGRFFDGVKQRLLTAGIPLTGINFHGFSTLMRYTLGSGKNPFTSIAQGLNMLVNPAASRKLLNQSLELLPQAVESGVIIGQGTFKRLLYTKEQLKKEFESQFKDKGYVERNFGRLWDRYKSIVEDPLMEDIIPAYKIETWKNTYNTYKTYMPDDVARRKAAEFTNSLLGGLNYDAMGRSPEMRNLMKFMLLAPDWFETNATLGANILKSFWDKEKNYKAYNTLATNLLGSYIFLNGVNKAMSGHYMWENEPGQKFSVDTGTKDEQGNTRYIQIYGTGADFLRLPVDAIDGIVNEDYGVISRLARNRLSPLGSTLVSFYSNTDYAGRPLFGTDKFGNPLTAQQNLLGVSSIIGQAIGVPTIFGEPARNLAETVITGKGQPLEKTLVQAVDLPVKYKAQVSDITKLQRERTTQRRELENAILNNDTAKAQELSSNFTQREISQLVSNINEKQVSSQLNTREKLFNRLSDQQKLELARTNPEFAAMYQKITQLQTQQDLSPINNFKQSLTGKQEIKQNKPKKPRKIRARRAKKVRAKKVRISKPKQVAVKKLSTLKAV